MKLKRKDLVLVSFMLFSLFFGAGNLIFPPFLGQNAGEHTLAAILGFLMTAVVLPVLGVVVVARFGGLDRLGQQVGSRFGMVFTVLIYLSIGPGLGIPRAASVPFEMGFAPYLPENANLTVWMALYSLVFFLLALWLCLNPSKLVHRIGTYLTPSLLVLLVVLFVGFLMRGEVQIDPAQEAYAATPFLKGFTEGYNTMDTIAALNFGLVIATSLESFGLKEKKDIMKNTVRAGICAGAIFTLACLTTCIGLINSISLYFSGHFRGLSYRQWVVLITGFSFLVCNLGLNTILSISVPILNAIYPAAIVLILLGLTHKMWKENRFLYPWVVGGTVAISVVSVLDPAGTLLPMVKYIPLYREGYGWLCVAGGMWILAMGANLLFRKRS